MSKYSSFFDGLDEQTAHNEILELVGEYCDRSVSYTHLHGKRVVYQPKSIVTHFEGISNGTDVTGTGLKRYQVVNAGK